MRILFALPGLHRVNRGAEVAFLALASELATSGDTVSLIGSGPARPQVPYRYLRAPALARELFENFPTMPVLRSEYAYEELTFAPGILYRYRPLEYDLTVTASYPFTNWVLRRPSAGGARPPHVFVTQNGDWPAHSGRSEYRWFCCDGLVCTNPDFFDRNKARWRCRLIPNGVDARRFQPGAPHRPDFRLPRDGLVVLMVSAMIPTKRVDVGVDVVSRIPHAHLIVAGDGPHRNEIIAQASRLMPGRFTQVTVAADRMPDLYRSANVFLHLSKEEAFGNVFIEAMACGLPVIGHDTPRLRWLVGNNEYLVDTEDRAAVTGAVERAASAPPQSRAARVEHAQGFSWATIAAQYRAFFTEIVASSRPRSMADRRTVAAR